MIFVTEYLHQSLQLISNYETNGICFIFEISLKSHKIKMSIFFVAGLSFKIFVSLSTKLAKIYGWGCGWSIFKRGLSRINTIVIFFQPKPFRRVEKMNNWVLRIQKSVEVKIFYFNALEFSWLKYWFLMDSRCDRTNRESKSTVHDLSNHVAHIKRIHFHLVFQWDQQLMIQHSLLFFRAFPCRDYTWFHLCI